MAFDTMYRQHIKIVDVLWHFGYISFYRSGPKRCSVLINMQSLIPLSCLNIYICLLFRSKHRRWMAMLTECYCVCRLNLRTHHKRTSYWHFSQSIFSFVNLLFENIRKDEHRRSKAMLTECCCVDVPFRLTNWLLT